MFQLTKEEFEKLRNDLIFRNGISRWVGTTTSKDFLKTLCFNYHKQSSKFGSHKL
jgi:hypothetical protein